MDNIATSTNGKAVLLIHGFLASPLIMRSLGNVFADAGYFVKTITLPGHGTEFNALRNVRAEDYIEAARQGFLEIQREQGIHDITPVGFSIGAILALILAFEFHCPHAVLLAPAFDITKIASAFPLLCALKLDRLLPDLFCTQSEPINLGSYTRFPIYSVGQISRLIAHYQKLKRRKTSLPSVYCAASRDDATVHFEGTVKAMKDFPKDSVFRIYGTQSGDIDVRQFPRIKAFSHVAIPVSPDDPYFGKDGEYYSAQPKEIHWGEPTWRDKGKPIKRLTYNPDFDAMATAILTFLGQLGSDQNTRTIKIEKKKTRSSRHHC